MIDLLPQPLWSGLALVAPLGARSESGLPSAVEGLSIDTRTLLAGDLFLAINGENSDGHAYVKAAFDKGAAAAVVDERHAVDCAGAGPLFVVEDVFAALWRLGAAGRARSKARVVAVTGSVGKTSTKEALRLVLTQGGAVHASAASYNNHWGVPLTLGRMPRTARFGVVEIGMNHAGEITPLVAMARPHVAIVTNVGPVHLEHFASVEAIADAKAEIFSGLEPGGLAIVHRDSEHFERLAAAAATSPAGHLSTFGTHADADARLLDMEIAPDHSIVDAIVTGRRLRFRLGAPGRHQAVNALAVLLAAKALGIDLDDAAASLAFFAPPAGRGSRETLQAPDGAIMLIDESYNANPTSIRAALALAGAMPTGAGGRRIAVLGDMLELGAEADALHAALAADVETSGIDLVFAAGPRMRHLFEALPPGRQGSWQPSGSALAPLVADALHGNDVVMVKGSNGSRMNAVVGLLKTRFAPPAEASRERDVA